MVRRWQNKKNTHTHTQHVSPDLVLQEVHIAVKQSVGGRQNSHRLHPRSSLQLTLHGHVGKTGQPKVAAFTEISNQRPKQRSGRVNTEWQIVWWELNRREISCFYITWSRWWSDGNHWPSTWTQLRLGWCREAGTTRSYSLPFTQKINHTVTSHTLHFPFDCFPLNLHGETRGQRQ